MSITARHQDDAEDKISWQEADAEKGGKRSRTPRAERPPKPSRAVRPAKTERPVKPAKPAKSANAPKAQKALKGAKGDNLATKRSAGLAPLAPKPDRLHIGVEPRVDLLPPEVRIERRNRRTRRVFGWGVFGVFLIVVVAVGGAFALNITAQAQLIGVQQHTAAIATQQRKYLAVRTLQQQIAVAQAAQQVGASTEIDWKALLDDIGAAQPAGMSLKFVHIDAVSPIAIYQQSKDPLQGPRVGTVSIQALSGALPDVPAWVTQLQKLPGVVDVVPGSVSLDITNHKYSATVTIHIDASLYTKRFAPKGK